MKKLIAISVVFALVAGVAFAVDLSASVIGTVKVITADSDTGKVNGGGEMNDLTIAGAGETEDGKFGGYIRIRPISIDFDEGGFSNVFHSYYAWWKPIDQLKLTIGKYPDGFWEYQGNSCWSFYQTATDTGVTLGGDNAWNGAYASANAYVENSGLYPMRMRAAFAEGFNFGAGGLGIEINPVDVLSIHVGIPFFNGGEIANIFKSTYAQVALNMSFGTIAFTFMGKEDIKSSQIFGFFSLTAIENLQIDFGLGTNFDNQIGKDGWDDFSDRLHLGLVVKYGADSWGIKFRSLFAVPIADGQHFGILFEVLPYFVINDSLRVYVAGGAGIRDTSNVVGGAGWHVNPYIEVGEEWGPKFLAGIKVYQSGNIKSGSAPVIFELPIAIKVGF